MGIQTTSPSARSLWFHNDSPAAGMRIIITILVLASRVLAAAMIDAVKVILLCRMQK